MKMLTVAVPAAWDYRAIPFSILNCFCDEHILFQEKKGGIDSLTSKLYCFHRKLLY